MAVFIEYGSLSNIVKSKQADAMVKPFGVNIAGQAVLEDKGENNNPCRYVISVRADTPDCLKQCYSNIILAAEARGISSVVMPLLGSECGKPLYEILGIATRALYLSDTEMDLYLVISKSVQDELKENAPGVSLTYKESAPGHASTIEEYDSWLIAYEHPELTFSSRIANSSKRYPLPLPKRKPCSIPTSRRSRKAAPSLPAMHSRESFVKGGIEI